MLGLTLGKVWFEDIFSASFGDLTKNKYLLSTSRTDTLGNSLRIAYTPIHRNPPFHQLGPALPVPDANLLQLRN